jgi:hypothetical protein
VLKGGARSRRKQMEGKRKGGMKGKKEMEEKEMREKKRKGKVIFSFA